MLYSYGIEWEFCKVPDSTGKRIRSMNWFHFQVFTQLKIFLSTEWLQCSEAPVVESKLLTSLYFDRKFYIPLEHRILSNVDSMNRIWGPTSESEVLNNETKNTHGNMWSAVTEIYWTHSLSFYTICILLAVTSEGNNIRTDWNISIQNG